MKSSSNLSWLKFPTLLYSALCISLLLFASACGDTDQSSSDTGSSKTGLISFSIKWVGAPIIKDAAGSFATRASDCTGAGVSMVEAIVYDSFYNSIASSGQWNCSDHSGRIYNVSVGSDRRVEILGKNPSGDILYQSEKTGINATGDQTTNAGTIPVTFTFIPAGISATAGNGL